MEKRDEEFVGSKAGVVAPGEEIHAGTGRRGDKGHAGGGKENIIADAGIEGRVGGAGAEES